MFICSMVLLYQQVIAIYHSGCQMCWHIKTWIVNDVKPIHLLNLTFNHY